MLLGLGAAATVSGGVLGTGALTSIQADRTIDVDVEGDSQAFLGLYDTSSGDLVDTNNGTVRIQLDDNSGGSGVGVNHGTGNGDVATTTLDPAFTIRNQSPNQLFVQIDHTAATASGHDVEFIGDDSATGNNDANEDGTSGDVISTTNNTAFIDRGDSDSDLTNDAVVTDIYSGGTTTPVDTAGYLNMSSESAVDVVLQVASDGTTATDLISSATIVATGDSSNLTGSQI